MECHHCTAWPQSPATAIRADALVFPCEGFPVLLCAPCGEELLNHRGAQGPQRSTEGGMGVSLAALVASVVLDFLFTKQR